MKITKENITQYLLTLQLTNAGYQVTYDEVLEMTEAKSYLDPNYKWYLNYTQTVTQSKEWFTQAEKIVKDLFRCPAIKAREEVAALDLMYGLTLKG